MERLQVRYGRFNRGRCTGQRRSTLLTLRKGDDIFFGISKCSKADRWDRVEGKKWAQRRLDLALSDKPKSFSSFGNLSVHTSGLFGSCLVDNIVDLLKYFKSITEFLPEKG